VTGGLWHVVTGVTQTASWLNLYYEGTFERSRSPSKTPQCKQRGILAETRIENMANFAHL
jgi:hypothetical protein